MKNLRFLCAIIVLTLVLTVPSLAGQITTWVAEPPPPPATVDDKISIMVTGQVHTGVTGQIDTGVAGQITTMSSEANNPVTEMALTLLHSVLSLF